MLEAFPRDIQKKINLKETQATDCPDDSDILSTASGESCPMEELTDTEDDWFDKPDSHSEVEESPTLVEEPEEDEWVWRPEFEVPPPEPIIPPPPRHDSSEDLRIIRDVHGSN